MTTMPEQAASHGFLPLLKPPGPTSQAVMRRVARHAGLPAGHAGTLDPDAAGVLVVAFGAARKLLQWLTLEPKEYWGLLHVGSLSDTLDGAGRTIGRSAGPWPDANGWARAASFLVGTHPSRPPQASNRRRDGVRGRDARRAGAALWLPPRPATIRALWVDQVTGQRVSFHCVVGRGTYVRALVRDWAECVGHAAYLAALVRTRVGPFSATDAWTPEEAMAQPTLPLRSWTEVWPHAVAHLSPGEGRQVAVGILPDRLRAAGDGPLALVGPDGGLCGVAEGGRLRRVFPEPWGHPAATDGGHRCP